jgi:chromodomain-containing protein/p58 integrase-like protein
MITAGPPPTQPWKQLTADFLEMPEATNITGTETYDELLVIVDTFSKMTILIPTKKTATCEEIFHLLWERVFSIFGIPDSILSDRDKIFKTTRWHIGAAQRLSTAYHQQTDGQTERKIQELRAYYRHYTDYEQTNWIDITPLAQYAVNDAVNASTGETPNFVTFGTKRIQGKEEREKESEVSHQQIMQQIHCEVQRDIAWAKTVTKHYYDQKRREAPTIEIDDRVYIRRRTSGEKSYNIKTGRKSQKMDCVKIGPYRVLEKLPNDNYRIALPERMRIHPIFHVSLLNPTKNPETTRDDETFEEFEVEHILDKRVRQGKVEYLVKWKGYENNENTWEPTEHLHCPDKVQEFVKRSRKKHASPTREPRGN